MSYLKELEEIIDKNKKLAEQYLGTNATKHDGGKPKFSTVPKRALQEITKVFTFGANKYGKHNYSGSMDISRYTDAAIRHLTAYEVGEDIDEIGTHHLANACASLMMALDSILTNTGIDDRNKVYSKNESKENS